jgi:hypothetical protein
MAAMLRADPPPVALRWVEQVLGGASVVGTVSDAGRGIGVLDGLREQPPNASGRQELEDALALAVNAHTS